MSSGALRSEALSEAKYLGYQVGRGLIRPQEKKVEAVRSAPRPKTKSQVRAFLGLAGYYHCFIPNFSSLAAFLTDLTRKGQPEKVQWTSAAEEAFRNIKEALTSEPILRAPDFSCPFLLQTDASDASDTGLGAILSQVQGGEEHPVLYISRKLSPAERNYATVEKEALAVKWAVLELWYYLLGRKFTLVTDHAPLQWMARAKDTNARVTRWFLALQDFHFVVLHRAGAPQRSVIEHVKEMRERIDRVMPLVWEHLSKAQQAQQRHYNRASQPREFQPGDWVMVLVPTAACKFLATWQGPYTVLERIGPVTYRIRQPGRRRTEQLYHVNLLKKWVGTREQLAALATSEPVVVDFNLHLSAAQKTELQHLIGQFLMCSPLFPGRPMSFSMISRHLPESLSGSGPTGSLRLVGVLLRRRFNKC